MKERRDCEMKISVVGIGTVGRPLCEALKYYYSCIVEYDKYKSLDSWSDVLSTDIIFICVPTDQGGEGRLDMCHVEETLDNLSRANYDGLIVIKSTLKLGYISDAIQRYTNLDIAVFPEWLRAVRAFPDTLSPEMTVLGVQNNRQRDIILDVCCWNNEEKVIVLSPEEAVMVKLTANALASTKISFANQIMLICNEYGIDAETVMNAIKTDPRCSPRYLTPGRAYGGYCLPKDTSELAHAITDKNLFEMVQHINNRIKKKEEIDKK